MQNFRAKPDTAMRHDDDLDLDEYVATIATARVLLGPSVRVQAPPNLVDLAECRALLDAGVDDFGGISPLTPDHVNPERPWPQIDDLGALCAEAGFALTERLTAHPPYLEEPWLDPRVLPHVRALRREDGLARADARPQGLPWQEPDGGWVDAGRTDLHASIDTDRPQHRPALGLRGRLRQTGRCCATGSSATTRWSTSRATSGPRSGPRSGTRPACPTRTRWP